MISLGACTKEEAANRPELIIGLVSPSGTRLDDLSQKLTVELKSFGYQTIDIRLSDLLVNFSDWKEPGGTEYFQKIKHLQEMGNAFRRKLEDKSALARAGIAAIRAERGRRSGNPDLPAQACAYIVRQLKHPDEVDLLRQVYGSSFLLIAGHAPREHRATFLQIRWPGQTVSPVKEIGTKAAPMK